MNVETTYLHTFLLGKLLYYIYPCMFYRILVCLFHKIMSICEVLNFCLIDLFLDWKWSAW